MRWLDQRPISDEPRINDRLRIVECSDDSLAVVGEVVTVVQVERRHEGLFVFVDGRKDFRRFLWAVKQ